MSGWSFSQWTGAPVADPNAAQTSIVMNDNYTVTANFVAYSSGGGQQGGSGSVIPGLPMGGGGGGVALSASEAPPTKRITGLFGLTDPYGMLFDNVYAYSVDELVKLSLPEKTYCLNANGALLGTVSIDMLETIPDTMNTTSLVMNVYSFWPDGAKFKPAVPLSFKYDPAKLPPGAKEENLKVVWWDPVAMQWVQLDTTIDTVNHIATAMISHFSMYSLAATIMPASFNLGNVSVAKAELNEGETTQLNATVTNSGDLPGSYQAGLTVNGAKQDEKDVTVAAGATADIAFNLSFAKSGTYTVDLNGVDNTMTVLPSPAAFKLDGLNIAPLTSRPGDDVQVSFTVFNSGEQDGTCPISATLDGALWKTQDVFVPGNSNQVVKFDLKFDAAGDHSFAVNEILKATFTVEAAITAVTSAPEQTQVTTAASTPATPAVPAKTTGPKTGVIILAVAGGLIVVVLLVIGITFAVRRRRNR